jgi:hypothetical protein
LKPKHASKDDSEFAEVISLTFSTLHPRRECHPSVL